MNYATRMCRVVDAPLIYKINKIVCKLYSLQHNSQRVQQLPPNKRIHALGKRELKQIGSSTHHVVKLSRNHNWNQRNVIFFATIDNQNKAFLIINTQKIYQITMKLNQSLIYKGTVIEGSEYQGQFQITDLLLYEGLPMTNSGYSMRLLMASVLVVYTFPHEQTNTYKLKISEVTNVSSLNERGIELANYVFIKEQYKHSSDVIYWDHTQQYKARSVPHQVFEEHIRRLFEMSHR